MEKRNYNPLNEGYSVKGRDTEGYKANVSTNSSAPTKIPFNLQSGVSKPSNGQSNSSKNKG